MCSSPQKSPTCAIFGGHRPCGKGDIKFLICHKIPYDHVFRMLCVIMGCVPLIISHHPAKFGGHRRCARWDFVLTLLRDLMCLSGLIVTWHCSWVSIIISDYPAMFGDQRPCGRGDRKLSICYVTSNDHVVRGSCEIMESFPQISHYHVKLVTIDLAEEVIFCFQFVNGKR